MMENIESFGQNLRRLIKGKGFKTFEQAANAFEISLAYLNQLMRGERTPSVDMLGRISKVLGVGIDELLTGDADKEINVQEIPQPGPTREELLGRILLGLAALDDDELGFILSNIQSIPRTRGLDSSATATNLVDKVIAGHNKKKN